MSNRKQPELIPIVSSGLFLVLTTTEVQPHLLTESAAAVYWDGWSIADAATRREDSMSYLVRQFFGRDAIQALPAPSAEALFWYVEYYEGPLQDDVRGLAAMILTGRLGRSEDVDGGARVAPPAPVPAPVSPAPAFFQPEAVS